MLKLYFFDRFESADRKFEPPCENRSKKSPPEAKWAKPARQRRFRIIPVGRFEQNPSYKDYTKGILF